MLKKSVSERVFTLIDSTTRAFRTREIIARVAASESAIKKALTELTVAGRIAKVRHGVYVSVSSAWIYLR